MDIHIDERLSQRLEEIASKQQRDIADVAHEAIEQYVAQQSDREAFRAKVRKHVNDHAWLLNELANVNVDELPNS